MYKKSVRFLVQSLCLSLFVLLIGCGLAACGSNSTTGGGGSSATPTPPKNCGTIKQAAGRTMGTATGTQQTGDCFWQAFQQCQPATMTFSVMGVDTLTTHTLVTKKTATSCSVVDTIQNQVVPSTSKHTTTVTCAGVTKEQNNLHFTSCGNQSDLVIPLSSGQVQ